MIKPREELARETYSCFYCGGFHHTQDCSYSKKHQSGMVHRIDCKQDKNADDCFGCLLAECHEAMRMLISELRHNPQRDSGDKEQIDKIIKRAMNTLPEFKRTAPLIKEEL